MVESFNVRVVTSISVTDTGDVIDRFITLEKRHHNEKSRQHTLTLSSTTYSGHQNNDVTNIDHLFTVEKRFYVIHKPIEVT